MPTTIRKRNKHGVYIDKLGKLERTADGIVFDSAGECGRYCELKMLQRCREIIGLEVHPAYPIVWPGGETKICVVELDFRYVDKNGVTHIEDFKGNATALSSLKRRLVEAAHGIKVELVRAK